ncbi:MAG: hypothetical protein OXG17_02245 [Chloroflexi bacterium]|nr:hypothetical protein [Chloroflexota bacterium]
MKGGQIQSQPVGIIEAAEVVGYAVPEPKGLNHAGGVVRPSL